MSSTNKIRKIVTGWQKFAKQKKSAATTTTTTTTTTMAARASGSEEEECTSCRKLPDENTFVVFVGKEQRRYILGEHYLELPLFVSLVRKSQGSVEQGLRIPCEVVMFDHLLWMLDNNNPALQLAESVDELVEFYAY